MLVGTYAFIGTATDPVRQSPDDMLSARRQEELQEVAARLADWRPQQVLVDWPAAANDSTLARYRRYASGTAQASRNEMVQVGFRLAVRLGLTDVAGIGEPRDITLDSLVSVVRRHPSLEARLLAAMRARDREEDSLRIWRRESTVTEHLRALNADGAMHAGHSAAFFGTFLSLGAGQNSAGARMIGDWYEGNAQMTQHLALALRPETQRVLVLVDADHVPALRTLLDESPRHCPVSPLPFLR